MQLPPFKTLIANSGKTAIDRQKQFSPIIFSDFSSLESTAQKQNVHQFIWELKNVNFRAEIRPVAFFQKGIAPLISIQSCSTK